jgi:O-antigen ligase
VIFFYLLVSVLPLVRHPLWSAFVGDLTVIKYVGVGSLAYALLYLPARPARVRFFETRQARLFVLFCLLGMASYLAKGIRITRFELSPFVSYLSFLLFFFITLTLVDSLKRLRTVLLVAVASVGFASLHVVREWQKYGGFGEYRPGYVTGDANYYSLSALLTVPIAFCLLRARLRPWQRWFCLTCLGVTLLGLTAAASRGGFVGLGAALLVTVWHNRERARILCLAVLVLTPLMLVSPSSPLRRLLNPAESDREATANRFAAWRAGLRMVAGAPLTGIGVGNFQPLVLQYSTPGQEVETIAHNTYLEVAAEMGVPGLLLYLAIAWSSVGTLDRLRRRTQRDGAPLVHQAAIALQAGVVGFLVAGFFVSAEYQRLFWLAIFLTMVLGSLVPREGPRSRSGGSDAPLSVNPAELPGDDEATAAAPLPRRA